MARTLRTTAMLLLAMCGALHSRGVPVATYTALYNACTSAMPGDTITLAPGVYTISGKSRIMITARVGPVLVRGATGDPREVVVEGAGQDDESVQMIFNLDDSPRWTFADLTTRGSYYHGFKFDHASTDCVLRNVIMRDHGESGVKGTSDPAAGTYPDRLLVERCDIGFTLPTGGTRSVVEGIDGVGVNDWIVRGCRFVNIQKGGAPAYAIFTKGNSSNTIIEGNLFLNCFIGASFGGGGTDPRFFRDGNVTYEHSGGIIRNNVIVRCSDAGVYINKGRSCRIYNNTVFECELTIQLRFAESSGWVRNNLVLTAPDNANEPIIRIRDGAALLAGDSNRAARRSDFMDPAADSSHLDLRPAPGSAAIDGGMSLADDVPMDYAGVKRPQGGGFDVGAFEIPSSSDVPVLPRRGGARPTLASSSRGGVMGTTKYMMESNLIRSLRSVGPEFYSGPCRRRRRGVKLRDNARLNYQLSMSHVLSAAARHDIRLPLP